MSINLTAPVNQLGYGQVGTNLSLALDRAGRNPALWPIGTPEAAPEHHDAIRRMVKRTESYDRWAPSLRVWHQFSLAEHVGKHLHAAMPIFELDRFLPNELHHLKQQDVLFVNSRWAAGVLVENGIEQERVVVAPLGVDRSVFHGCHARVGHLDEPTTFLNVGKWEYRKGHDVLLKAFCRAFDKGDNVRLVMHCFNPCLRTREELDRYNADWTRYYKSSPLGEKILVSDRRFDTQAELAQLMASADCGVFPARAEGWNLDAAEMMAMGKQVILTNYAGHTEYATADSSLLIEVDRLEDAHDGVWFRADNSAWGGNPGRWAAMGEGQIDQLVEHMRAVHRRKQGGESLFSVRAVERMKAFTWDRTAEVVWEALR